MQHVEFTKIIVFGFSIFAATQKDINSTVLINSDCSGYG
jgi:hypothetical protein